MPAARIDEIADGEHQIAHAIRRLTRVVRLCRSPRPSATTLAQNAKGGEKRSRSHRPGATIRAPLPQCPTPARPPPDAGREAPCRVTPATERPGKTHSATVERTNPPARSHRVGAIAQLGPPPRSIAGPARGREATATEWHRPPSVRPAIRR